MMRKSRAVSAVGTVVSPLICLVLCLGLASAGCNALGVLGQALPRRTVPAAYTGLAGQTVVVYVWADRGVRTDWPYIQRDITSGVQSKLQEAIAAKTDVLKDTRIPLSPNTVARFQEDHPELDIEPITDIAPRLGVTRVIYIELQSFQTRSEASVDLFRGSANALIKVLEVKDGKSKVAYESRDLRAIFPPKSFEEGVADLGDDAVYSGTVRELTTQAATLFVPHPEDD